MGHELEVVRVEINLISNTFPKKYHVVSGLVFLLNPDEMDVVRIPSIQPCYTGRHLVYHHSYEAYEETRQ